MAAPTQIWRHDRNDDANRSHATLEHAFMFSHIRSWRDCLGGIAFAALETTPRGKAAKADWESSLRTRAI